MSFSRIFPSLSLVLSIFINSEAFVMRDDSWSPAYLGLFLFLTIIKKIWPRLLLFRVLSKKIEYVVFNLSFYFILLDFKLTQCNFFIQNNLNT